jgi:hypothetical protein
VDLAHFFNFLIYKQSVELLGRVSARRKAATYSHNKRAQTSIPQMGFEPTNPVFERTKIAHALARAASMFGITDASAYQNYIITCVIRNWCIFEVIKDTNMKQLEHSLESHNSLWRSSMWAPLVVLQTPTRHSEFPPVYGNCDTSKMSYAL